MHAVTESITFQHKKDCILQHARFVLTPLVCTANFSMRAFHHEVNFTNCNFIVNCQILVSPIFIVIRYWLLLSRHMVMCCSAKKVGMPHREYIYRKEEDIICSSVLPSQIGIFFIPQMSSTFSIPHTEFEQDYLMQS